MEFIDKIPRSLSGKILRRELKEKVTAALLNVVNNRANEEEQNVIRSKNPDVEIPDNLSWTEFVFQHFDEYEDREAMVRSITGCFLFFVINRPPKQFSTFTGNGVWEVKMSKCQMYVYSGHALSYTKLVHRHATQTEGNKYFK